MSILSIFTLEELKRHRQMLRRHKLMQLSPEERKAVAPLLTDRELDRELESYTREILDEGEQMMIDGENRKTIIV